MLKPDRRGHLNWLSLFKMHINQLNRFCFKMSTGFSTF